MAQSDRMQVSGKSTLQPAPLECEVAPRGRAFERPRPDAGRLEHYCAALNHHPISLSCKGGQWEHSEDGEKPSRQMAGAYFGSLLLADQRPRHSLVPTLGCTSAHQEPTVEEKRLRLEEKRGC